MKIKHIVFSLLGVVGLTVALRELGVLKLERFSHSAASYSLVKSDQKEFPSLVEKVIVRRDSLRSADQGTRRENVLYLYVDGFVFDQDWARMLPLYKQGREESYLRFEFVLNNRVHGGGIVSIKCDATTTGLRSLRGMKESAFKDLIHAVTKFHGLKDAPVLIDLSQM